MGQTASTKWVLDTLRKGGFTLPEDAAYSIQRTRAGSADRSAGAWSWVLGTTPQIGQTFGSPYPLWYLRQAPEVRIDGPSYSQDYEILPVFPEGEEWPPLERKRKKPKGRKPHQHNPEHIARLRRVWGLEDE